MITVYADNTDLNDQDLTSLANWDLLYSLTLGGKNITAAVLRNVRPCPFIGSVSLRLVSRGFEPGDIVPLEDKKYLSYLCLEGNSMPEGVMDRIGRLEHLRYLDLGGCPVTDTRLAHLVNLQNLARLCLRGSKVSAGGLKYLVRLKKNYGGSTYQRQPLLRTRWKKGCTGSFQN